MEDHYYLSFAVQITFGLLASAVLSSLSWGTEVYHERADLPLSAFLAQQALYP